MSLRLFSASAQRAEMEHECIYRNKGLLTSLSIILITYEQYISVDHDVEWTLSGTLSKNIFCMVKIDF